MIKNDQQKIQKTLLLLIARNINNGIRITRDRVIFNSADVFSSYYTYGVKLVSSAVW